jgi:hypothetical protein
VLGPSRSLICAPFIADIGIGCVNIVSPGQVQVSQGINGYVRPPRHAEIPGDILGRCPSSSSTCAFFKKDLRIHSGEIFFPNHIEVTGGISGYPRQT